MDMKICIDTSVFLAVMNKESDSIYCEMIFDAIEKNLIECILSTIVIAEILVGFDVNADFDGKQKFLDKIKLKYKIMPVTLEIAIRGAELRASSNIRLPDALIYATLVHSKAEFLISNDFSIAKKEINLVLPPKDFITKYSKLLK